MMAMDISLMQVCLNVAYIKIKFKKGSIMELKEQWIKWEPLSTLNNDFSGDFYTDCVIISQNGFKIIMRDHNNEKKIHIKFKFSVSAYRKTDKLYAWPMQKDFLHDGSYLYKVINSKYIQWLSDISNELSNTVQPNMQHFVMISENSIFEVLDSAEPEIEFIDLP